MIKSEEAYNDYWYEYIKDKDNYTDFDYNCPGHFFYYYGVTLKNVPKDVLYKEQEFLLKNYYINQLTNYEINFLRVINNYLTTYERKQKLIKLNYLC